ncbi:hypothetical protein [Chitinophaga niabensis]|nr:hypothetical protein [Chitinophaga niabensis]
MSTLVNHQRENEASQTIRQLGKGGALYLIVTSGVEIDKEIDAYTSENGVTVAVMFAYENPEKKAVDKKGNFTGVYSTDKNGKQIIISIADWNKQFEKQNPRGQ